MTRRRITAFILSIAVAASVAAGETPKLPMPPRLEELLKQLTDPDWDTRMEAATAIGRMGAAARSAIPNLLESLKDPVPAVRMKAIDAFMFMGPAAAAAAPAIVPFLNDPDDLVRVSAVIALPRVTPDRASIVPLLKKSLADKAWTVQRRAALELIDLRAEVAAAVAVLRQGKDSVSSDRLEVIAALARVGSPSERTALIEKIADYLRQPDRNLRIEAIRRLSGLGMDAVPYLITILKAEEEVRAVKRAAIQALTRIGPDAKAALPVLREMLLQPQGQWRRPAQRAIDAIEGREPPAPEERTGPIPPLPPPGVGHDASPDDLPGRPAPAASPSAPPPR